jgi:acetylornithine deacetylase
MKMARKEIEKGKWDKILSQMDVPKLITYERNLVKIPSYLGEEEAKADYVAKELERIGAEVYEMPLPTEDPPRRRSVIGILRGDGTGRTLLTGAHLDTHAKKEGQLHAHDGVIEDGKIYGVGTGDSHPGLAAIMEAMDTIKRSGVQLKGDVIFVADADELGHKYGAKLVLDSGVKADMCIWCDASEDPINMYVCNTGKVEVEIRVKGTYDFILSAFAERKAMKAVNAVVCMHKIMDYLFQMQKEEPYFHKKHPLLPGEGAAFYIGPIIGGSVGYGDPTRKAGVGPGPFGLAVPMPTWCRLRVGARYWPGETAEEFVAVVNKWVDKAKADYPSAEIEVECYLDDGNVPWEISPDAEVVDVLGRCIKYVHGKEPKCAGFIASGDQVFYSQAPMESIWYGCNMRVGRADEYVTVKELSDLCKVYVTAIMEVCT